MDHSPREEELRGLRRSLAGPATKRASDRYDLLVKLLGEEMAHRYGWKAKAAAALGVHASYVSKILGGEVAMVGPDLIVRAAEMVQLPASFFLGEEEPTSLPPLVATRNGAARRVAAHHDPTPENSDAEWSFHSDEGREMWRSAYAAWILRGVGTDSAERMADHAMDAYEARFYPALAARNKNRSRVAE